MRITVDTNVLVSSMGWNGAEAAVVELVLESKLELCISIQILSEFYRVCRYPKFAFSGEEIDGFVGRLLSNAVLVKPEKQLDVIVEDREDNRILECAVEGSADYIITGDRHLLNLHQFGRIKLLRAPVFLKEFLSIMP